MPLLSFQTRLDRVWHTALSVSLLAGALGVHAAPFGYAINSDGFLLPEDEIDNLYRIDLATGAAERLGPTGFLDLEGLAFSADGQLYGTDDESKSLVVLSEASGQGIAVGALPGNLRLPAGQFFDFGLAASCDGLLLSSDNAQTLYRVDEATGEAVLIGETGAPLTGIAVRGDEVFGIGDGQRAPNLYRVDPMTGAATEVGPLTGAAPYNDAGLDFDEAGRLWAITDRRDMNALSQILEIDPATGAATVVAETLGGIESLAIAPPVCDPNGNIGAGPQLVPTLTPAMLAATAGLLLLIGLYFARRRLR